MVCQANTWEVDTKDIDCPVYTSMIDSILCEKKTPLKKTFQLFCVKAHYSQQTDSRKLSDALEKEIRTMVGTYDMSYSYADIQDITYAEAEVIENRVFEGTATMDDKIRLQKYFFKERFSPEAHTEVYLDPLWNFEPVNVIEYAWDNQFHTMFGQMERLFLKPDNVFGKIQDCNGQDSIFPSNIKKMKLSPEIIAQIFQDFKFRYITEISLTNKICHEIYNSYFGISIIDTETDSNRHLTYHCNSTKWAFFHDFVTKYSKRNPDNEEPEICLFDNEDEELVDIA